jgi:DNA-binding MarR family transcriptional regulator
MTNSKMDETEQQFLIHLFEQTGGDSSIQVSMYDIGGFLGLDKEAASKVAEDLIGSQLVEIRTLSGGIGILNSASRHAVELMVTQLKGQISTLGLDYDTLSELMADLKTIDAQMASSRPKTLIIRECLRSITAVLNDTENREVFNRVNALLDE